MEKEFEYLKKVYGSHSAVARELGISIRAYRYYRSGKMPKSKARLISYHVKLLKIKEI